MSSRERFEAVYRAAYSNAVWLQPDLFGMYGDEYVTVKVQIAYRMFESAERQALERAIELCKAEMEDWPLKSQGRAAAAHCIERLQDASSEKEQNNG